ncbi:hypothetical protein [Candidatus Binatus sp.]|uniref:hypothetical protein n=1 Tax=Candidatus Binatus sp. TaxID=2811406 RepID=UPI002F95DF87
MALVFAVGLLFGAVFSGAESSKADTFAVMPPITNAKAAETCTGPLKPKTPPEDLDVTGACTVGAGTYVYKNVRIYGNADGTVKGSLAFADAAIDFWAESIIIENNGTLTAGVAPDGVTISPVGTNPGGKITIHLYGAQQSSKEHAVGVHCHDKTCGIPSELFTSNNLKSLDPTSCVAASTKGGTLPNDDCFYQYEPLMYDDGGNVKGFYGYKVLGLGYGGTLRLYGLKGATYPDTTVDPTSTGTSWVRLNNCATGTTDSKCTEGVLQPGATTLTLSRAVNWKKGDQFVVTTTDYLTSHTEQLTLAEDADGNTITIASPGLQYPHHAATVDLASRIPAGRGLTDLTSVDTRAAVALLSRNIRIVSGGDKPMSDLPTAPDPPPTKPPDPKLYFGGHVVFRQGFTQLQVQGVEFYQLGEGGRMMHYPVHFHMARQVPTDTYVKDSSIWDSMTRFIVLHATQGVLLARNVGYRSIGMGYYLEDGTETNNKLYANIGISAIAAVNDKANYRGIPGILARNKDGADKPYPANTEHTPYDSDFEHPSLFWIMNGWNDFEYNMAVGAEMCGNCYWMPPGANSGSSRNMYWTGYSSLQKNYDNKGTSPLMEFLGNSCSTAMVAFHVVGDTSYCGGINTNFSDGDAKKQFHSIENDLIPPPVGVKKDPAAPDRVNEDFYPRINNGGNHHPTKCPSLTGDCSTQGDCSNSNLGNCMVIVLDRFTSSFNFATKNFAAIWLRPQFNLVLNSAITDILGGGLTFVTGGGYTRADALIGHWALARKTVFIGETQDPAANPYATNGGPVNPTSFAAGVKCGNKQPATGFCIPVDGAGNDLGVTFDRDSFSANQRFFNIYDGPALEDSNAFLDITATQLTDCLLTGDVDYRCFNSKWMEGTQLGIPGIFAGSGKPPAACYLPNAAIAWKQPNGFYYPPSFHSTNLYFNSVEIHHYVIEPKFLTGTYKTDDDATKSLYCNRQPAMFSPDFTDIDRQTELNDDDGSLTGLVNTVSVNEDAFFQAPTQDVECKSDVLANTAGTAITSPYDYVTTVVYPDCATVPWSGPPPEIPNKGACNDPAAGWTWSYDCANSACYGVALYRQYLNTGETTAPFIRMAASATGQRETMAPNNGLYYIDTTVDENTQRQSGNLYSVFQANKKYHVFLLFAKPGPPTTPTTPATRETYQIYVGKGLDTAAVLDSVVAEKANVSSAAASFTTFSWPAGWTKTYQPLDTGSPPAGGGILTVTVDLSTAGGSGFPTDYDNSLYNPSNPTQTRCQPSTMCAWSTTNSDCECNISANASDPLGQFYLRNDCMQGNPDGTDPGTAFCKWAISDVDYPDAGAYGFSFIPGSTFATVADPVARAALRPSPSCFPQTVTNPTPPPPTLPSPWNLPFTPASSAVAQDCFYASAPPSPQFCTAPGP